MSNRAPAPQPGILDISPYVPGESSIPGGVKPIKLSSNETPLGPSPKAIAAYKAEADNLERYPDGGATSLRAAIAAQYGLNPDRIVCGCGSDELINLLAHAYIGPGDEAIYTEHGFLMYKIATLSSGGKPVSVPEKAYRADVDAILERVGAKTKIVFLANPNNPTGTYLPHEEVRRLHRGLPSHTLLVLDAAYSEYVRRNDYEAGLELVATTDNTVMTRTFSKIYGLSCPAAWLGLLPGGGGRRAEPRARTVQRNLAGDRGGRGGPGRSRARRDGGGAQRPLAGLGVGRDREAGAEGDAERRQLRPHPLPDGKRPRRRLCR